MSLVTITKKPAKYLHPVVSEGAVIAALLDFVSVYAKLLFPNRGTPEYALSALKNVVDRASHLGSGLCWLAKERGVGWVKVQ